MLVEFSALEQRNPRGLARVTTLVAHLMRHQFVHVEDRGGPMLIETLRRPELFRLTEAYFDVAGFRLVFRELEGWAGLLPDPERIALPRMRVDQTIALLVARRLWEEALQQGDIQGNGTTRTTLNEAHAAYEDMVAGTRRAALTATEFRDCMRELERRALVRLGEYDAEAHDMELDIRAVVVAVAGDDFVASLDRLVGAAPEDVAAGPQESDPIHADAAADVEIATEAHP